MAAPTQQEIAQKLVELIKTLQPSIVASGNKLTITPKGGQTIKLDRYRAATINDRVSRFR